MEEIEIYVAKYSDFLEEIRKRIYHVVIVFAVTFLLGLCLTDFFIKFFVTFLKIKDVTVVVGSPFQLLDLAMNIGFFMATVLTAPFLVHQLYSFLRGGLLPKERKIFFTIIPAAIVLYVTGFAYGFGVMYYAFGLIAEANVGFGIVNLWDITLFMSQIMITSALLGIIFEFPIVLTVLMKLGVMDVSFLRKRRRTAIATILIFVALLPPTDGLSFIVMSVPLIAIYELTILVNSYKRVGKVARVLLTT